MHRYDLSSVQAPTSHGVTETTTYDVVLAHIMVCGTAAAAAAASENVLSSTCAGLTAVVVTTDITAAGGGFVDSHLRFVGGSDSSIGRRGSCRVPSAQTRRYMLIPEQGSGMCSTST